MIIPVHLILVTDETGWDFKPGFMHLNTARIRNVGQDPSLCGNSLQDCWVHPGAIPRYRREAFIWFLWSGGCWAMWQEDMTLQMLEKICSKDTDLGNLKALVGWMLVKLDYLEPGSWKKVKIWVTEPWGKQGVTDDTTSHIAEEGCVLQFESDVHPVGYKLSPSSQHLSLPSPPQPHWTYFLTY